MKMMSAGNLVLQEVARRMSPAALQVAAGYFTTLLENNQQLLDSWEAVTEPTPEEKKDPRLLIIRLAKHVCDTQVRDMGSVTYTDAKPKGEDVIGMLVHFHLDPPEEGHELKHMLLQRITMNNLEMVLKVGGKMRDSGAPATIIGFMLYSVGKIEFTETGEMLRGQVDLLKQVAAEKGVPLHTSPPPLDAWLPPKGAPGH